MRHLILAALTAVLLSPATVSGQTRRASDALVLARVCAHEAGWDALADCSAIYDVLRGGAERHGMTLRAFAHAYSGRALRGQTSRPWMAARTLRRPARRHGARVRAPAVERLSRAVARAARARSRARFRSRTFGL